MQMKRKNIAIRMIHEGENNSSAILSKISGNAPSAGLENPAYLDRRDIHVP